jgi:hypothetical protein
MKILAKASKKNYNAILYEDIVNKLKYHFIKFTRKDTIIYKMQIASIYQSKTFKMFDSLVKESNLKMEVLENEK